MKYHKAIADTDQVWLTLLPFIGLFSYNPESFSSTEQIKQLYKVSQIELGFPHNFFQADMVRNCVYNGTFEKIYNHRYSQLSN